MTSFVWQQAKRNALDQLTREQRFAVARAQAQALLTRTRVYRNVDYIQDPDTGRFGGSRPQGGTDKPDDKPSKGKHKVEDFSKDGIVIDEDVRIDKEKSEKFLKTWDHYIGEAPAEFRSKFLGGLDATMRLSYNDRDEELSLRGEIKDAKGNTIGEYSRSIDLDHKTAYSSYFKLKEGQRGGDIGKRLLAGNVEMYKKLGIEKLKVSANIDVGGYAWARYGYVPTSESWNQLSGTILSRLSGMERRERGGRSSGGDTYTPESWDMMGEMQHADIESAWRRATADEFYRSEEENWRDSGQALEEAKVSLAAPRDHLVPGRMEWAQAALKDWRESRTGPDVPFTNDQILEAVSIEYESRYGDGRGDPAIYFDDGALTDPEGFDPDQLTLPGVDPIEPHELLTEKMRDEIISELTDAFNSKAQDMADRADAPDYLPDSVSELQDTYWGEMSDEERFAWAERNGELPEIEIEPDEDEEEEEPVEVENADALAALKKLANSSDPKALWQIAGSAYGKDLLLNSSWQGVINLKDKETMDRFHAYVGKGKA